MDDLISRQQAIDALYNVDEYNQRSVTAIKNLPSIQPDITTHDSIPAETGGNDEDRTSGDCISRTQAIDALKEKVFHNLSDEFYGAMQVLDELPSVQPTLYGYNIGHLELIARVLQKEGLPPERVVEALTDIGRIVAIVSDEFEETLRKAVEDATNRCG